MRDLLLQCGLFEPIDAAFADFARRRAGAESPELAVAAALASKAVREGHCCCELQLFSGMELEGAGKTLTLPEYSAWREFLLSPACRRAVAADRGLTEIPDTPLVLDGAGRLYLQRYAIYEEEVARELFRRSVSGCEIPELPPGILSGLSENFRRSAERPDCQQLAVFAAASGNLTVVTGGPGTGKTTVVAALLALLLRKRPNLRAALCAPTGKAQARLQQSIFGAIDHLSIDGEAKTRLKSFPCSTLHALLKFNPVDGSCRFNRENPLPYDLVVVDECSMISLSLTAAFLAAVRPDAAIVLLGDKDQLASVDAGAVLADICAAARLNAFSPEFAAAFEQQTGAPVEVAPPSPPPLTGRVIELLTNHRFGADSAVGRFCRRIKHLEDDGVASLSAELAAADDPEGLLTLNPDARALSRRLDELLERKLKCGHAFRDLPLLAAAGGAGALAAAFRLLDEFKILCAMRNGVRGVVFFNRMVREKLRLTSFYAPGVPLMIARNDYRGGLLNGDIGLAWRNGSGGVRIHFPDGRSFAPAELPEHETVFAMTIHKSQGSGFHQVLVVLPEADNPVLTRELLYTGISRAQPRAELWGSREIIATTLARRTLRQSGLAARLAALAAAERV